MSEAPLTISQLSENASVAVTETNMSEAPLTISQLSENAPVAVTESNKNLLCIRLHRSFKGFAAGVVSADYKQRAFFEVRRDGVVIASATFEGQGNRVNMKNIMDNREHWSFGPFDFDATLYVVISNQPHGGTYRPSKMVGPLTIEKKSEADFPMEFYKSTVISDDAGGDNSHDDCTFVVLEYK
ncbi:hypothetical protein K435DRAFT_974386 [Dendrothele bispora CBS 962.96]|uniref:Uncharacterized protein n=1 Tax=Dendrothele bispora (strain CBS 962.96) TaxID=1314807 RepID=A0A4S8KLZ3_DENBC|nr:hypothetical protein K435DRAFT_974386 [Dendrothele bispora CBS 962.96]